MTLFSGRSAAAALTLAATGALSGVAAAPASAQACSDVHVVAARGTFEPGGPGLLVGDRIADEIQHSLAGKASVSRYGVNYDASADLAGSKKGSEDMVNQVKTVAAQCPETEFVLLGYSQGALVVDNAIGVPVTGLITGGSTSTIPAALEPRVAAILLYGNPIALVGGKVTGPYQSRTKEFCNTGDPVCGAGSDVGAHLSYGTASAKASAAFVAEQTD